MATPTIPNGETQFFPIIYEGNGGGQRVGKFVPFTDNGTIANSVIFNDDDNAYLSRTNDAGDRDTFTISVWVKRGNLGSVQHIFDTYDGSSSNDGYIRFNADNTISIRLGSPSNMLYTTNRTFEDTSKFYHIMLSVNTNDSTAGDRAKLYVDGDRITSFSTQTNAGSSDNTQFNYSSATFRIGSTTSGSYDFDGYLAEFNQVDGQSLLPASFGVTDTSTGRWIPKTVSPYPTTTTTFTVTVADASGNKYFIDSSQQATVTLIEGATYRFDQSDSSNAGHPLRFSTTSNGTHGGGTEFTSGVTTAGTPGLSGAYTEITVPTGTATLYYYCTNHSGMGGTANTQDQYGTNGFRLKFQDSSSLGDDTSGNTNDFTATNLATTDQTTDSPTQNFNNMGGSDTGGFTKAEGNLKITIPGSGSYEQCVGLPSFGVSSGKWYWEVKVNTKGATGYGWKSDDSNGGAVAKDTGGNLGTVYCVGGSGGFADGEWTDDYTSAGSNFSAFTTANVNDVIMFALDLDNQKGYVGLNGTWFNSANPANGTGSIGLGYLTLHSPNAKFYPMCLRINTTGTGTYNFGQRSFAHTAPTGFSALQQDNLPETAKGVSGLVWTKNRDATDNHQLYDSSRGRQKALTITTSTQSTVTDGLQKFLAGGQQIEDDVSINTSGESYVSWNWTANGGTTASNTDGSVTSTTQVNSDAGFSIITFTGNGTNGATIGHGLSSAPQWIIGKSTSGSPRDVLVWHHKLTDASYFVDLNNTEAQVQSTSYFNSTAPTSSLVTLGTSAIINGSSETYVMYCWHEVEGFSKFGKYSGNGSTDGPFIYTGFRPAMVMVKSSSNSATNWEIRDNLRSSSGGNNPITQVLYPNLSSAEVTTDNCDFLSNGFKWRSSGGNRNESGYTYIYMAFAEHPFVGDGTNPVTAR